MRARGGQVAIYLAMVLVGICVLVLMNVGVFLSVRAKNRATNAADAAALAAARHQGELLNRIGNLNLEHLKSAIENDEERCHEIVLEQMRLNFLGPLDAIAAASRAAMENGAEPSDEMAEIFKAHVSDIRLDFVNNPDLYIPPWDRVTDDVAEGCDWSTYASRLEAAVSGELVAGPENAEFADEINSFPLMAKDFYEAAQGKTWCWFRNYGFAWLLDINTAEMPSPFRGHSGAHWNSEVYPLHLRFATWTEMGMGFNAAWTNLIVRLTGCSEAEIASSTVITNELQVWAFYDGEWRDWDEISTEHNSRNRNAGFPLIGKIKSEYNVKGCMAQCRVAVAYEDVLSDREREVSYKPMAKPFGTVVNMEGELDRVTALYRFVTPAFDEVRLIPVAPTGWITHDTSDAEWRRHVRHLKAGERNGACRYCQVLNRWDDPDFRRQGVEWLNTHACEEPGEGGDWGGAPYAY